MSEEYTTGMKVLGDDATRLLRLHEAEEHDGDPCLYEAINCIAYIAHRIGAIPREEGAAVAAVMLFMERVEDYRAIHSEHHTSH